MDSCLTQPMHTLNDLYSNQIVCEFIWVVKSVLILTTRHNVAWLLVITILVN